jgi:hypothetical protein
MRLAARTDTLRQVESIDCEAAVAGTDPSLGDGTDRP